MVLYHGSKLEIKEPIVKGSNQHNDYGPAFYLTEDLDSAKAWACKHDSIGVVNKYTLDIEELKVLDLSNKKKYSILNWLAILMHFREIDDEFLDVFKPRLEWLEKYYINVDKYDIVNGYRADDAYFRFPLEFIRGNLSYEDLESIYQLGNLGTQYALISEKSIKKLRFDRVIECEPSFVGVYFHNIKASTLLFKEILKKSVSDNKTTIMEMIKNDKNI